MNLVTHLKQHQRFQNSCHNQRLWQHRTRRCRQWSNSTHSLWVVFLRLTTWSTDWHQPAFICSSSSRTMIACSTISRLRNLCIGDSLSRTALGGVEIAERPAAQALSEELNIAIEKTVEMNQKNVLPQRLFDSFFIL